MVPRSTPGAGATSRLWVVAASAGLLAPAESDLQLTSPILWTMIAIGVAGSIITFAFLVYAVWKFRDPSVRRRKYG